ncbi:cupin domain-containing protein [Amycolatopsis roodepoortensis]|uniref:cupin domain-containing protein n=1 Tax=Amycolatopsis roodepoortensis TaxID=700274 RepID=UPI00214AB134|nr:cupin domain-containing protein [Amycolatopsis roodepoortensis]UUV31614.1 cupin domain-containing protein [Amycolatopsis roodepoortensis]
MPSPDDFTAHLGLQPLPVEGGRWAQSWRDETASAIYYLLAPPETSAPHRLDRLEIYAHHAGAPVRMLLLFPDGSVSRPVLGPDVAAGQRPQVVAPAGVWQASVSTGEWSLVGTVVVPPYTDDCVEFRSAAALAAEWPDAAEDLAPWLE